MFHRNYSIPSSHGKTHLTQSKKRLLDRHNPLEFALHTRKIKRLCRFIFERVHLIKNDDFDLDFVVAIADSGSATNAEIKRLKHQAQIARFAEIHEFASQNECHFTEGFLEDGSPELISFAEICGVHHA